MEDKKMQITNHDFLIYKDSNDDIKVSVMLINNDIWLTQNLIAELFGVGRSTITGHINNILNSGELDENNTVGKTDVDNSKKPVKIYNLDMIIADEGTCNKFNTAIQKCPVANSQKNQVNINRNDMTMCT